MGRIFFAISLWLTLTTRGHAETIGTPSFELWADTARPGAAGRAA